MYKSSCLLAFLPVLIIVTIIHQSTTASAQFAHFCSNDTMFTNGSTYQTNLNTLFRTLASNATNNPSGFYRTTVGNPSIEAVYGEYLCTGDQNISSCHQCVATAITTGIPTICPNMKVAILWYDECLVRYSNSSFFNNMDNLPARIAWHASDIIGDKIQYMDVVTNMISNVIAVQAAEGGLFKKFATDFVNYSAIQPIYGLGQCTPDLNPNDCYQCLNSSIQLFHEKPGGRVLAPSCIVRFEAYPFFNLSYLPQAPPPSPSPLPSLGPSLSLASDSKPIPIPNNSNGNKKISTKVIVAIIIASLLLFSVVLCLICICLLKIKARKLDVSTHAETTNQDFIADSLQYDFATLLNATNNFSDENKLGEGGFGGVYKGTLSNGQLIAVKRLSASSSQGIQEFKTEVLVVAKLQHRNLVRLLGFCYTEQEKLLVYEYVRNKSLDNFIFEQENRQLLDWERRYNIIKGIARGLLYLHHDSQLRIIHRDLKASNILLDDDLNPKISDFGTSRIFGVDHSQSNYTNIVVGTYGYMAPEYALQGQFSIKSDAYSFGVLVLEIISGRKATSLNQATHDVQDLLSYAWRQWEEGTPLEFVDPTNNTRFMLK
ncbi:cysteine-rich receptor-like protein kinase 6 [Silene latifolia]|uniref:cysteine-rich receptor-like protein kinase 6 n=1 Tax=Silene latifolia TaxID=37657 RepID=UPI003D7858A7